MRRDLIRDSLAYVVFGGGREVHSSSVAIRRDAFAKAGAFPEGVCVGEDSDLWIRLAWTTRFVVIPTWLSTYHTYAGDSRAEIFRCPSAWYCHPFTVPWPRFLLCISILPFFAS